MERGRPGRDRGGLIHTYQRYDPLRVPPPGGRAPDLASAAFEHMLAFGGRRRLTPEELAAAVRIDPSQIAGLGPSLDALIEMLEARKRRLLETYETSAAVQAAHEAFGSAAAAIDPPSAHADAFRRAVAREQIHALERLWYAAGERDAGFGRSLLELVEVLGDKYQVDELEGKYRFTGRREMDVPTALAVKAELEAIDRLLKQLREALKDARLGVIDMDALREFADAADVDALDALRQQIDDYLREQAALQGLQPTRNGYRLTPRAYRLFQARLLETIFSGLESSRSGRHTGPIEGEGAVELPRTRPYEFGDSPTHMDIPQSLVNALLREGAAGARGPGGSPRVRMRAEDIEIHRTRNNPRCATAVLMDMSGSMRYGGQFIAVKRMAIALDGLIRREYPGDFLALFEVYSLAKRRTIAEVPALLPKPVTIHEPIVRLKADLSDPDTPEAALPPHFTNLQHGLRLARQALAAQDTPNRQVVLLTDGLPTAHFEGPWLYLLYPPDGRTEEATMREAMACARDGITINIFLLPSWSQSEEDVRFAHRVAERTGGRVFFTAGDDVDRFVLWDYVARRRSIIG